MPVIRCFDLFNKKVVQCAQYSLLKTRIKQLHTLYSFPNIKIKKNRRMATKNTVKIYFFFSLKIALQVSIPYNISNQNQVGQSTIILLSNT